MIPLSSSGPSSLQTAQSKTGSGQSGLAKFLTEHPNIDHLAQSGVITEAQAGRLSKNEKCAEIVNAVIKTGTRNASARVDKLLSLSPKRLDDIKQKLVLLDEVIQLKEHFTERELDLLATLSIAGLKKFKETTQIVNALARRDPEFSEADFETILNLTPPQRQKILADLGLAEPKLSSASEPSAVRGQQLGKELRSRTSTPSVTSQAPVQSTTTNATASADNVWVKGVIRSAARDNLRPTNFQQSSRSSSSSNSLGIFNTIYSWLGSIFSGARRA